MPTLHLDALSTTALALLLLALGSQLKKRSRWLTRLCVPSPVIAGFGFAFLVWLLRDRGWLDIGLDTSLQTPLMVAFFTTVGLGGSLGLLRKGGKTLLVYLSACWALAILQNLIGVGSAGLLGLDPLARSRWKAASARRRPSARLRKGSAPRARPPWRWPRPPSAWSLAGCSAARWRAG